jgi:hypothetical protein
MGGRAAPRKAQCGAILERPGNWPALAATNGDLMGERIMGGSVGFWPTRLLLPKSFPPLNSPLAATADCWFPRVDDWRPAARCDPVRGLGQRACGVCCCESAAPKLALIKRSNTSRHAMTAFPRLRPSVPVLVMLKSKQRIFTGTKDEQTERGRAGGPAKKAYETPTGRAWKLAGASSDYRRPHWLADNGRIRGILPTRLLLPKSIPPSISPLAATADCPHGLRRLEACGALRPCARSRAACLRRVLLARVLRQN